MEGNSYLILNTWSKAQQVISPKRECLTSVMLNGRVERLSSKYLCLCHGLLLFSAWARQASSAAGSR